MKIIKILNYIFPLIIGALCSYMGSLTHIGKNNILQIIMIFTLSVIFSILLFYDAKTELDKLQKSYHNNYSNIITKFLILKNIVIQLFAIITQSLWRAPRLCRACHSVYPDYLWYRHCDPWKHSSCYPDAWWHSLRIFSVPIYSSPYRSVRWW